MIEELRELATPATLAEPAGYSLPSNAAVVEIVTKRFREELERRGAGHWRIYCGGGDIVDVDAIIKEPEAFGNGEMTWETLTLTGSSLPQPGHLWFQYDEGRERIRETSMGMLFLEQCGVAVARWTLWSTSLGMWTHMGLLAAEDLGKISLLRQRIGDLERLAGTQQWKIIGSRRNESWDRDWDFGWDQILVPDALRQRLENEVIGFFTPEARQLYSRLDIPYRRGCLLHGSPGNGKTSIIRVLGSALPDVAMIMLQPHSQFDDDDLKRVLRHWVRRAPAMLVIEDIDSIFRNDRIPVSSFLNMLDGITQPCDGGVLLVATTNYPDRLDRAINNRPGRFDVVLEIPTPDRQSREEYFVRIGGSMNPDTLERMVRGTDGMSFAHLAEILRVAGFQAIRAGRSERQEEDWLEALEAVKGGDQAARGGFEVAKGAYGFSPR